MKKVVFFVITILLGLMLVVVSYQGFYMDKVQSMIQTSLDNKNYDELAKSFLPFFNKEEEQLSIGQGKCDVISYEALIGEQVKVTIDDKQVDTNRYQEALVLFVDDIDFTITGVEEEGKFKNYTNVTLYNGDKKLVHYFNEPMTAKNNKDEDVVRYYTDAAEQLKFVMLSISKKDIDKELNGKVTKIEVVDGHNNVVRAIDCDLDFDSTFFTDASKIVVEYDEYLKNPKDQEVQKKYQEFYKSWFETYTANPNYGLGYVKGEISTTGVIWKTVAVMSVYIVICSALGYFILRKKPSLIEQVKRDHQRAPRKETKGDTKVVNKPTVDVVSNEGSLEVKEDKELTLNEVKEEVNESLEVTSEEKDNKNVEE